MKGIERKMNDLNKLYAVQYLNYASGACTIAGLFRDENLATTFLKEKNEEIESKGKSLPDGQYVVKPIYTDF